VTIPHRATSYGRSSFIAEAQLGQWDFEKRSFLTQEQLEENWKLDNIEALAIATPVVNISTEQQIALAKP